MPDPATSPLGPLLDKLEHWSFLNKDDQEALLALPHMLKAIEAGQHIVRQGDRPTHSCLLRSGFAYRHKIVAGGGRQIISIHMAGDMVDLQNTLLGTADHGVQALSRCELAFIPREAIKQLSLDRPAVGLALWYDTLVDGSIYREWIANVGRRDAKMRLAHLLCEFALRLEAAGLGNHTDWELPMTQEQLADCTGLTSVHVNRMLKSLEKDGFISRTRRAVTITDWKKLARAGDFDSTYLHLDEDQLGLVI
jgi:CRP-like cAMP-binding protein